MSGDEHEKDQKDEKASGEGEAQVAAPAAAKALADEGEARDDGPLEADPESWPEGSSEPQITLDRYLSKRHPAPRMAWTQIFSMLIMLVGLILIMVYKDSCGRQVSEVMGAMNTADAGLPGVPVRVRLAPKTKPGAPKPPGRAPR